MSCCIFPLFFPPTSDFTVYEDSGLLRCDAVLVFLDISKECSSFKGLKSPQPLKIKGTTSLQNTGRHN
jgi:hypothetical protein